MRILILGAGPSGLFLSKSLLKKFKNIKIDLIEKKLYAGGLLRYGVAPDHPEVKSALKNFDDIFNNENLNFFGNVYLNYEQIKKFIDSNYYSKIILASGAKEKKIFLRGEELLKNKIISANNIVYFYNNYYKKKNDFEKYKENFKKSKKVVIIGNGNVSLDIARLLTKNVDKLKSYQVNPKFIELINDCNLEEITIVARRGVIQAACDIRELRELLNESDFDIFIDDNDFKKSCDEKSLKYLDVKKNIKNRPYKRKFNLMEKIIEKSSKNKKNKKIIFRFLLNPVEIIQKEKDNKFFLKCKETELKYDGKNSKAVDIEGKTEYLEFDFLIKSLGYEKKYIIDDENIEKCGWASTGGKGKLNDSYFNCTDLIFNLDLKNEKLNDFDLEKELKKNKIPFFDKNSYLKLREYEIKNNIEIQEKEELSNFLNK